jgi:very-short-patch-repair endonuclease
MHHRKKEFARFLRKHQTACEEKMWRLLRNKQFKNLKFRRQHVVGGFVVDFYCNQYKFAVEIDGGIHMRRKGYDELRDEALESKGIHLLRVSNPEIENDEEMVIRRISEYIEKLNPSPSGRGALKNS